MVGVGRFELCQPSFMKPLKTLCVQWYQGSQWVLAFSLRCSKMQQMTFQKIDKDRFFRYAPANRAGSSLRSWRATSVRFACSFATGISKPQTRQAWLASHPASWTPTRRQSGGAPIQRLGRVFLRQLQTRLPLAPALGNIACRPKLIPAWLTHYNEVALHSALAILVPATFFQQSLTESQTKTT